MSNPSQPTLLPPSTFILKHTLAGDYEAHLTSAHGPCVYFGRTHNLSLKPSLSLHGGPSKTAPVIATAKALKSKWQKAVLTLGDGDNGPTAEFTEGTSSSLSSTYSFSTSLGTGRECQYRWSSSASWTSGTMAYECRDLTNDVVVARFEDNKADETSLSKVGTVHMLVSAPGEFTALLLLGVMIVKEREVRVMISVLNGLN